MRADPPQPRRSLDTLTDKELRRLEKSATPTKAAYIPGFPQSIIQAIVDADAVAAFPLVLAIHRQLVVTKRKETPLNEAIWRCAGSPSAKRRGAILKKLRSVPNVIKLRMLRTATTYYSVSRGDAWHIDLRSEEPTGPSDA